MMLSKSFARNSVQLPAIGQGTGDGFWDSKISYRKKVSLLRQGIDSGMSFVDTAEEYGDGLSEEIVGEAIAGVRDNVVVATKVSPNHLAYQEVLDAADRSLKRLGTDYVDLYQVHWPNPSIPISDTMAAFRVLLDQGKIRCAGVCNFTPRELDLAQDALGEYKITSAQNEYNLLERTVEYNGLICHCMDNGLLNIAYSPLDLGRIASLSGHKLEALSSIAVGHDRTPVQVALNWLVSHPTVVAIPRSTKQQHVIENGQATDFQLSDEEIEQIDSAFADEIVHADTDRIQVSLHGDFDHSVYQTLDEAIENKLGFVPSPVELAKGMESGDFLKPVRLVPSSDAGYDYDLIGGRIRYWAWVIAHDGQTPIPAYVQR